MDLRSLEFAHDLKMPIQLIYSCVQLLEMELQNDSRAGAYLRMLMESANQLQTMVRNALDDSRLDANSSALRLSMRDVVNEVREICGQVALFAGEKRIAVSFWSNADAFVMKTDPEKLGRILHNLLSNALRFTPERGRVGVATRIMGDSVEISVSDNGCGIAPNAPVFEIGYTTGGHGYGLAIVRKYAEQLGGTVSVKPNPEGGSCFTLRLPVLP